MSKPKRGYSIDIYLFIFYCNSIKKNFCCFVCRPLYVQLCIGWGVWNVRSISHCFCGKNKINLLPCICVLGIKTIFSNILQHTYVCNVCSKCNTEQKKAQVIMMNKEVFSIDHSVLHWAHQCSTGS